MPRRMEQRLRSGSNAKHTWDPTKHVNRRKRSIQLDTIHQFLPANKPLYASKYRLDPSNPPSIRQHICRASKATQEVLESDTVEHCIRSQISTACTCLHTAWGQGTFKSCRGRDRGGTRRRSRGPIAADTRRMGACSSLSHSREQSRGFEHFAVLDPLHVVARTRRKNVPSGLMRGSLLEDIDQSDCKPIVRKCFWHCQMSSDRNAYPRSN